MQPSAPPCSTHPSCLYCFSRNAAASSFSLLWWRLGHSAEAKAKSEVFSTFALGNAIFILIFQASINDKPYGFLTHWHLFAAAPLLFAAATCCNICVSKPKHLKPRQTRPTPPILADCRLGYPRYRPDVERLRHLYPMDGRRNPVHRALGIADIHYLAAACQPFELERAFQTTLAFLPLVCPALHRLSPRTPTDGRRSPAACRRHVLNFVILNNR